MSADTSLYTFLIRELAADVEQARREAEYAAHVAATVADGQYYDPGAGQRWQSADAVRAMTGWLIGKRLRSYPYGVGRAQRVMVMKVLAQVYRDRDGYNPHWTVE